MIVLTLEEKSNFLPLFNERCRVLQWICSRVTHCTRLRVRQPVQLCCYPKLKRGSKVIAHARQIFFLCSILSAVLQERGVFVRVCVRACVCVCVYTISLLLPPSHSLYPQLALPFKPPFLQHLIHVLLPLEINMSSVIVKYLPSCQNKSTKYRLFPSKKPSQKCANTRNSYLSCGQFFINQFCTFIRNTFQNVQ